MAVNLVIFASGSGTNAENIIQSYHSEKDLIVRAVFCNNPKAKVISRAKKMKIPCEVFDKATFHSAEFLKITEKYKAEYIVLAGFLWKIPPFLVNAFPDRIINIHPALLPKFGGKGMYGEHVHRSVIEQREKYSGITIHLVNEHYDEGRKLFEAQCEVDTVDTPESLAKKIHQLEYEHFPKVIADYIRKTT